MISPVARVLFFPLAPGTGLAHAGACLAVAGELERRGHETVLAYGGSRPELVGTWARQLERVEEIPSERAVGNSVARWYDEPGSLDRLVLGDVELIRRIRPDVAVVDMRLSAVLACELTGVPDLALLHFLRLTSPYRDPERWRRRARELRRPQRAPYAIRRLLDRDVGGGKTLRAQVRAGRASLGLPPREPPWEGRLVACTTTPLLDPAELPPNWRYVGPIDWSVPGGPPPEHGSRPLVVVIVSTTGESTLLPRLLHELRGEPIDLVVSAGGREDLDELRALAPNARVEPLLAAGPWLDAADVAIVEGGHLTASTAHRAGTPVVVVPHRADQWAWADRVERLGTGIAVREPRAPGAIRRAVRRVLRRERYRRAAAEVAAHLRDWDGARSAADLVEELARG